MKASTHPGGDPPYQFLEYFSRDKEFQLYPLKIIDVKIQNEILENRIQRDIKSIIHHDQMGITPGMLCWFNIWTLINVIHQNNRVKCKNDMIMSIDIEKSFDKIQHPFMTEKISAN